MYCIFCGEEIPENTLICPECGLSQDDDGTISPDVYVCPVCGAENPPGERKCNFCCSIFPENGV